jgi:hypothetical protein
MRLRGRWLPCVSLMLLFPIQSQAQERTPVREWGRPAAVTASVPSSSLGVAQASGSRSGRDSLLNGTVIGAAIGAVAGMALVYATSDSELGFEQYSYGALVFGGIGAGVGLGVDALLNRGSNVAAGPPKRIAVKTRVSRKSAGVGVTMRW